MKDCAHIDVYGQIAGHNPGSGRLRSSQVRREGQRTRGSESPEHACADRLAVGERSILLGRTTFLPSTHPANLFLFTPGSPHQSVLSLDHPLCLRLTAFESFGLFRLSANVKNSQGFVTHCYFTLSLSCKCTDLCSCFSVRHCAIAVAKPWPSSDLCCAWVIMCIQTVICSPTFSLIL